MDKVISWEEQGKKYWEKQDDETLKRVQRFIESEVGYNSLFHYKLEMFGVFASYELPVMPEGLEFALVLASKTGIKESH